MKAHLLSLRRVRLRSTLLAVWSLIATLTSFWGIFGSRDENASSSSTCLPCHGITRESSVNTSMRLKGFQKSDPLETEPSFSCYSSKSSHPRKNQGKLPTIYVITPTYERPAQLADLTRMAQTLAHVAELFWVLVQDSREREPLVHDFLRYTNINYTYITGS
ncbi:unnamed protein product [Notodromas monacha]|uniref:Galactosylgalactosylxylosylprotein 3-beta-glucuronosyltransferase n=1 Tax=Notodromas monacha TaxID=399045 RepID=A0A7R9GJK8_9CRUS|nr:unnamed protein product [Notodromas monacha]CAG0924975.1 unnamed protein product [Notodromas monacha]